MAGEVSVNGADATGERVAPPGRRGSRDERREAAVRGLAAGLQARCAFCGEVLPPIPSRGGRPSPYCPADPERYGVWGAKVISCALLDEQREIWVSVYGADQPLTPVDVHSLRACADSLTGTLASALAPVREELVALQQRLTQETADAITARDDAHREQEHAREQTRQARADRDTAVQRAERAEQQATTDRAELRTAQETAADAERDRDAARTAQQAAEAERDTATADRQRALTQAATAQDRITELQATLARERAVALADLDHLRRDAEDNTRQSLAEQAAGHQRALDALDTEHQRVRNAQTAEHERALDARVTDLTGQLRAAQQDADRRVDRITGQLTEATTGYARSLAPLHEQLAAARAELSTSRHTATTAQRERDELATSLRDALNSTPPDQETPLRDRLTALLPTLPHSPEQT